MAVFTSLLSGCTAGGNMNGNSGVISNNSSAAVDINFKTGVWTVSEDGNQSAYMFFNNMNSGEFLPIEYEEEPRTFTYSINSSNIMKITSNYSDGSYEDRLIGVVSKKDEDNAELKSSDGIIYSFKYVGNQGINEFVFYSNEDIDNMIERYFTATEKPYSLSNLSNPESGLSLQTINNPDGTYTRIYKRNDERLAEYVFDRTTGKGTEKISNENINLNEY